MLGYYVRLALASFGRDAGLTVLMTLAIAIGVAACDTTLTVYRTVSGNPIWWKSDKLFAVTLRSTESDQAGDPIDIQRARTQLTFKDATYLVTSDIPTRKVIMYEARGVLSGAQAKNRPMRVSVRITTADFFSLFDVPFRYGGGWNAAGDQRPEPAIVLSRAINNRLFGGADSTSRTVLWNGRPFRVAGVLDGWSPQPKYYDLNNGPFNAPEEVYVPWGWGSRLEQPSAGNEICGSERIESFKDFLGSECVWIQMWVELPTAQARTRMQSLLENYWAEQHRAGRFPGRSDTHLSDVSHWLREQRVVQNDQRLLVAVAIAFFAVCLLNTLGLLLSKFQNGGAVTAVRRALGASRGDVMIQHLVEVGVLSCVGACLGLVLTAAGLWGVRVLYAVGRIDQGGYGELAHFSGASILFAGLLAAVATCAAGLYPAWRVAQSSPAVWLKKQ